jgi:TolB-like protein
MKYIILLIMATTLAGCANFGNARTSGTSDDLDYLITAHHKAVAALLTSIDPVKPLDRSKPIIVASLVDIDDLLSSTFGRISSEQIATKLTISGFEVVELKLRGSIFVKSTEGELLLSREIKEITTNHKAQAVLVGTYAEIKNHLYITLKLVGTRDNIVLGAHDYVLPINYNLRSILWNQKKKA